MAQDSLFEHIDVRSLLETAVIPSEDRSLNLHILDDAQIPAYMRRRITTKAGYTSEYTSATAPYTYCQSFWMQKRQAARLMFGRWVKAAIAGQFVGAEPIKEVSAYSVLGATAGFGFAVDGIDGGSGSGVPVDVNSFNLSAASDFGDVLAEINSVLQAVNSGAFAAYEFTMDGAGNLVCCDATDTGSSSAEVTVQAPASGVDITTASYLNTVNGIGWFDGMDAETIDEAYLAIKEVDNSYYCVTAAGLSQADKIALSTTVNADLMKVCCLWEDTYTNCNDPNSTTQAFPVIRKLNHGRTFMVYDPGTLVSHPDAVIVGAHISAQEGSIDWANQQLFNATSSHLGTTKKSVLDGMKINYFETNSNITTNPYGMTASGDEMRWVVGNDWFVGKVQSDTFTSKIKSKSWGLNSATFGTLTGIIRAAGREAIDVRGFCVETAARPFTINMPDPDSFDHAARASHDAQLLEVYSLYLDSAIYDMKITGTMSL